jgi:hypothetical protein
VLLRHDGERLIFRGTLSIRGSRMFFRSRAVPDPRGELHPQPWHQTYPISRTSQASRSSALPLRLDHRQPALARM